MITEILPNLHNNSDLYLQLEPLVNGPFTPDLANPISQLGKNAREKGWPTDIKVGKREKNNQKTLICGSKFERPGLMVGQGRNSIPRNNGNPTAVL